MFFNNIVQFILKFYFILVFFPSFTLFYFENPILFFFLSFNVLHCYPMGNEDFLMEYESDLTQVWSYMSTPRGGRFFFFTNAPIQEAYLYGLLPFQYWLQPCLVKYCFWFETTFICVILSLMLQVQLFSSKIYIFLFSPYKLDCYSLRNFTNIQNLNFFLLCYLTLLP